MRKSLKNLLAGRLTPSDVQLVSDSYDIIGDIAVIRVPEELRPRGGIIAEAIMSTHRRVKTVLSQTSPVSGDFRLRGLEWVGGERGTETLHREYGCVLAVDLETCYFSPRLSHERMRIARLVKPNETLVNMFAGVGSYSIIIAKHSAAEKIYSIDANPSADRYVKENIRLNRVDARVTPLLGDAKEIVTKRLRGVADRVLMPLPEKAYEYLDTAFSALKSSGGYIHYYDFTHAGKGETPTEEVRARVSDRLRSLGVRFDLPSARVVRTTGPNWYQVVVDIHVFGRLAKASLA